eukprot:TRINITY_DN10537_c0_g1_i1.p1 TRINITY_DN10537_c0_g1~~TRINITY_DN10537_c0_g1_i1.p1  ORF type:complete len:406 (+),score=44.80 TRINITY_DN10537_c0_g1_i1:105-1322(+)
MSVPLDAHRNYCTSVHGNYINQITSMETYLSTSSIQHGSFAALLLTGSASLAYFGLMQNVMETPWKRMLLCVACAMIASGGLAHAAAWHKSHVHQKYYRRRMYAFISDFESHFLNHPFVPTKHHPYVPAAASVISPSSGDGEEIPITLAVAGQVSQDASSSAAPVLPPHSILTTDGVSMRCDVAAVNQARGSEHTPLATYPAARPKPEIADALDFRGISWLSPWHREEIWRQHAWLERNGTHREQALVGRLRTESIGCVLSGMFHLLVFGYALYEFCAAVRRYASSRGWDVPAVFGPIPAHVVIAVFVIGLGAWIWLEMTAFERLQKRLHDVVEAAAHADADIAAAEAGAVTSHGPLGAGECPGQHAVTCHECFHLLPQSAHMYGATGRTLPQGAGVRSPPSSSG